MSRRKARETALQILYQVDMTGIDPEIAFDRVEEAFGIDHKALAFARELVFGTLKEQKIIDKVISEVSIDWELNRIALVDRNIMRMALYEIFFREDIPENVSVNEAIELAKAFGGGESGKFINGILGKVVENLEKYRYVKG